MKNIYKAHLPGSLGLLTVDLFADSLLMRYASPGAKEGEEVNSLQEAVDLDFVNDDLVNRLNYCSFLNGVIAEKVKAATKNPTQRQIVRAEPSIASHGIQITAANVADLPANLQPETRRKILAGLGIEDPRN